MAEASFADLRSQWRAVARAQQKCRPGVSATYALACEKQGLVELKKDPVFGRALARLDDAEARKAAAELPALYAELAAALARYPAPDERSARGFAAAFAELPTWGEKESIGAWAAPRVALASGIALLGFAAWRVFR